MDLPRLHLIKSRDDVVHGKIWPVQSEGKEQRSDEPLSPSFGALAHEASEQNDEEVF